VTCFQDTATEVLGVDAQELGVLRDTDEAAFDDVFHRANFKEFTFKVRSKMDMFNVSALVPDLS
jgi:replication factor A1